MHVFIIKWIISYFALCLTRSHKEDQNINLIQISLLQFKYLSIVANQNTPCDVALAPGPTISCWTSAHSLSFSDRCHSVTTRSTRTKHSPPAERPPARPPPEPDEQRAPHHPLLRCWLCCDKEMMRQKWTPMDVEATHSSDRPTEGCRYLFIEIWNKLHLNPLKTIQGPFLS